MLDDVVSSNQIINEISLGQVISDIWGETVKKMSTVSGRGSGYRNLRKRVVNVEDKKIIETLDQETVDSIKLICASYSGWIVDCSPLEEQAVTLLKVPTSEKRTVEGRRLVCEVVVTLDPPNIALRTHGDAVLLKDIAEELGVSVSFYVIDTVIRLVEATSFCLGRLIIPEETDSNIKLLEVPVAGSRVLSTTTSDSRKEKRLISTSCLLITSGRTACRNCVYVSKLWANRERKRRAKEQDTPHRKCNLRYMARDGLEGKINTQRKELKSDGAREKRLRGEEMIEFMENDSSDLMKIFDQIESKDVPPDMKLLWDMQIKQLSVKSPKGYRWHPRLFFMSI